MTLKYLAFFLWFLIPIQSCTNLSKMSDNQRRNGHYRLYTYPEKPAQFKLDQERFQTIALIGTNNLNGQIRPKSIPIPNRLQEKRFLKSGGVSAIKTYKDILKNHYKDQALFLDSGSFLHESDDHDYTVFLRNYLSYDVGALGPKEFQIATKGSASFQRYLQSLTKKSQFKILNSNLFDLQQAKQIEWEGVEEDYLAEVSELKVGFISIITPLSAESIPDKQINGLYFQNATKRILTKARTLRRKGANILVLMINGELDCTSQQSHQEKISEDKVNFQPFESYHCDTQKNSLYKILTELPPKTIDVVFSNGGNSKVTNYIEGYPVLQTKGNGQFISWIEFVFDKKHNIIDPKQTKIFQPVQLCHQFLKKTQDCFTKEDISEQEIQPATFLGKNVIIKELPELE